MAGMGVARGRVYDRGSRQQFGGALMSADGTVGQYRAAEADAGKRYSVAFTIVFPFVLELACVTNSSTGPRSRGAVNSSAWRWRRAARIMSMSRAAARRGRAW